MANIPESGGVNPDALVPPQPKTIRTIERKVRRLCGRLRDRGEYRIDTAAGRKNVLVGYLKRSFTSGEYTEVRLRDVEPTTDPEGNETFPYSGISISQTTEGPFVTFDRGADVKDEHGRFYDPAKMNLADPISLDAERQLRAVFGDMMDRPTEHDLKELLGTLNTISRHRDEVSPYRGTTREERKTQR